MTTRNQSVIAIDLGTSSCRCVVYDVSGDPIASHSEDLELLTPQPGWVEQDPMELYNKTVECLEGVIANESVNPEEIKGIGITNQRETTIVWDSVTGKPLYNALVWLDTRTGSIVDELIETHGDKDFFRSLCGLPITTYFSALKVMWLMRNVPDVQKAIEGNTARFGTVDSWLVWNLTGGAKNSIHVTDVTNASRTMLLNLDSLEWDPSLANAFGIPLQILPEVKSSAEVYGKAVAINGLGDVPICGILGDQQAALVGQNCFKAGEAKCTYGTGSFLLYNTGEHLTQSASGLLTTVAYKLGKDAPVSYALEGSVAICGAGINWLRDNMGLIQSAPEVNEWAAKVKDSGGVYFVPAFSGLFAPYWKPNATGLIRGLTQHSNKSHICRALLESICFSGQSILAACEKDSGVGIRKLKVDGGVSRSDLLLQIQSDLSNIEVERPSDIETAARGAAIAAAIAIGLWHVEGTQDEYSVESCRGSESSLRDFSPKMEEETRAKMMSSWDHAVTLSFS